MLERRFLYGLRASAAAVFLASGPDVLAGATRVAETQPQGPAVRIVGEPLRTALPTLSREVGLELRSSKELAEQRVTLLGPRRTAARWKEDVRALLSPEEQAGVFWTSEAGKEGSLLRESKNRRELAARLRDSDQQLFRRFVAEQYEWAKKEGWPEYHEQVKHGEPNRVLVRRLGALMVLDTYGAEGRERLIAGEPMIVPFSRFVGTEQEPFFREWFRYQTPDLVELPPGELSQYAFVFLRERSPTDPHQGGFTLFRVKPSGFVPLHGTILRIPHRSSTRQYAEGFKAPVAAADEPGRRVSFCLTPDKEVKAGTVDRTMDQLLDVLARETGTTVVADGYLRRAVQVPANLMIRDCTVERVVKSIAEAWDCDWRVEEGGSTVFLRAKYWWLEDVANVTPEQVAEFKRSLGSGKPPALEDLVRLAELEEPQVRKLLDTGICESANGLLAVGLHDGVGPKQVLQFYNRLSRAQQQQVRSPQGLPLATVDPALVQRWLHRLLIANVGALTPERRQAMVLTISPLPPRPGEAVSPGWRFGIRNPNPATFRCNWFASVLLTGPPIQPQPIVAQ